MYKVILLFGIVLITVAYVFFPTNWVVIFSLLSLLTSLWDFNMNKDENEKWVSLLFYCFFMWSWYNSSSYLNDNDYKGWFQIGSVFSVFILFVFLMFNKSLKNIVWTFVWTLVLVVIALIFPMMVSHIFVFAATYWTFLTYLFYFSIVYGILRAFSFPFKQSTLYMKQLLKKIIWNFNQTVPGPLRIPLLIATIISLLLFVYYHPIKTFYFTEHHGHLLLNEITELNKNNILNLYPRFAYNYALSGWFFIKSESSNKEFMTILNYGQVPNIMYSPSTNEMKITIKQADPESTVTVCVIPEIHLQKWNHILVNINTGTVDIFWNGKLYKSVEGIVPEKSAQFVDTGAVDGIDGIICNVMYFERPLAINKIKDLFHSFKNYNPPIV
jgi:hypothetical protein